MAVVRGMKNRSKVNTKENRTVGDVLKARRNEVDKEKKEPIKTEWKDAEENLFEEDEDEEVFLEEEAEEEIETEDIFDHDFEDSEEVDEEEEEVIDFDEEESVDSNDRVQSHKVSSQEQVSENSSIDDWDDIVPFTCKSKSKVSGEEAMLSIVSTPKCGHRITISRGKVLDRIGVKDTIQLSYSEKSNAIIIGKNLQGQDYLLKKVHGKAVIYNRDLVEELAQRLKLDFSNRTTVSFSKVEFKEYGGDKVAIIPIGRLV